MTISIKTVRNIVAAVTSVNRDIRNYYWMVNQISEFEVIDCITTPSTIYGIEATISVLPK